MQNDWIIDVLADLNAFAKCNGMPALASQLEIAADVASVEIASQYGGMACGNSGSATEPHFPEAGRRLGT
ncbi:MAG: hypothetical protein QGI08_11570 [Paracoccaceae bacterium]|nr:hypothetical protein [Paracoccaceae bacterium]